MLNDPLANVLSKILNYEDKGKKELILHPCSKMVKNVLKIFQEKFYVGELEEVTPSRGGVSKLYLIGSINKCGVIKPRFSVTLDEYDKFEKRYLPSVGVGILIVSTSKGLMTHVEAKKKKLGGRLIAYCY